MRKQKKTRHLPSSTPTGGALTAKLWTGEMHACGTFVYSEDEKRIVGYLRKSDRVATLQHLECVWLMKKNVASPCLLERAVPSVLRLLFVYDSCAGVLFVCNGDEDDERR